MTRLKAGSLASMLLIAFFVAIVLTPFTLHKLGIIEFFNPGGVAVEWEIHDQDYVMLKGATPPRNIFGGVALTSYETGGVALEEDHVLALRPILIYPSKCQEISISYAVALKLDKDTILYESGQLSGPYQGGKLGLTLLTLKISELYPKIHPGTRRMLRLELESMSGYLVKGDGSIKNFNVKSPITLAVFSLYKTQDGKLFLEKGSATPFPIQ